MVAQSSPSSRSRFLVVQAVYLIFFIAINAALFFNAEIRTDSEKGMHPVFWNASDGQRYWGVAKNLSMNGSFTIGEKEDTPLKRAGPLPAIVFAVPMKLAGFEASAMWIIAIQCAILFLGSLVGRKMCDPFPVNKDIFQGLLIFNPLLINLAHHGQSDLLFMALMTVLLSQVTTIVSFGDKPRIIHYLLLGITCGLLTLARPLGFYLGLALPFIILIASWWCPAESEVNFKGLFRGLVLAALIATIVTLPWAVRNYSVFGSYSVTQSEGIMMEWHYKMLKKRSGSADKPEEKIAVFARYGVPEDCEETDPRCKSGISRAYFHLIVSSSPYDIGEALVRSWIRLFFAGGFTQMNKYLGVDSQLDVEARDLSSLARNFKSGFVSVTAKVGIFLLLFLIMFGYTIICRSLGLAGLWALMRRRDTRGLVVMHAMVVLVFLSMYLFSGIARFRAPLEPTLALFTAAGITLVINWLSKKRASKTSSVL